MTNILLNAWRNKELSDKILKKDLEKKDSDLNDIFKQKLEFGTAGIRGIMGAGTSKINEFTVSAAAQAYAKYLIKYVKNTKQKGVIIGHDNRHNSILFSEISAKVLMQNGIKSYLYKNNELQPTPLVSYTIRKLKLAGGIIITASHNPKEYNGFKVYNSKGGQLMPSETQKIQNIMKNIDPLLVTKSNSDFVFLDNSIVEKYINETISGVSIINKKNYGLRNIKIAFSPLHGTSLKIIPKVFSKLNCQVDVVQKQSIADANFSNTKSSNPEESKAYNKVVALAKRKKSDIAIVTDPDADRIGVVVKYKKRFKYLNGNQVAALYLDYKLSNLKREGKLPKDAYIVKTNVSGELASKIARKFNVKVYETHVGFKNIADLVSKTSGTFILGYEESYGMVINSDLVRDKDSIQSAIGVAEMTSYYKSQNINLYDHLKDLFKLYGIHRTNQISKKINSKLTKKLMGSFLKLKKIGNKKVIKVEDYRKNSLHGLDKSNFVKVIFNDSSWIAIRPSGTEPKVKIYVQSVGTTQDHLIKIVSFEKEVETFVEEKSEVYEPQKWSWKGFFKYLLFFSIIIVILFFVFTKVYNQGGPAIWKDSWSLANRLSRFTLLSMHLYVFSKIFIDAWMRKRLIESQGEKVKIKHLFISSIMGVIISYITPLAIGGDAIGYWYLRRKGIKRGPLLSSFILSTLIWQFGFIIQTAILFPAGFSIYKEIIFSGNPQSEVAFAMFCFGLFWDLFATFMILSLTLWKRLQEFIIRNSIKLLEWLPFKHVQDPGRIIATYQYELGEMRNGVKFIFRKKLLLLEVIIYELIPKFFNYGTIILIMGGFIQDNLSLGKYMSVLVTDDMIQTANTLSLTPGGSGINEWLSITINSHIYNKILPGDISSTTSALDFMWKIIFGWPLLIISVGMILTVALNENKKAKKENNKKLKIYFSIIWISTILAFILWYILYNL